MASKIFKLNNNKGEFLISPSILQKYYQQFYPCELIVKWLTKNDDSLLKRREFCFTLLNDKYIRYQSFKSLSEIEKRISNLNPMKIDIGGIYNKEPKNYNEHKEEENLICQEKELVFDIDITDYDEVRRCCKKADVCSKCWKYIVSGAKILDRILVEDFGFTKIFYVFSGRRGIHCWVSDKRACILKKEGRTAIERYIYYEKVNQNISDNNRTKRNFLPPIHPSYLRAVSIIKNDFYEILNEQDLLSDDNLKKIFRNIIYSYFNPIDIDYIDDILNKKNLNSLKKFNIISQYLKAGEKILKKKDITYCNADACLNEFMMYILYPRLDSNVTIQVNHLLKGPFCVHPKTGYISVPMSIEKLKNFFLDKIPKIEYLIENDNNNEKNIFFEFVKYFENFVKNINGNNDINE